MHRRSGTHFVWKNIGFRASALSQKRISCETSFKTPSATHQPAPLAIPFTLRERYEEDGKKQFSASENHFLEPLPLHKAPALEEDGKKRFSAFFFLGAFIPPQGTSSAG